MSKIDKLIKELCPNGVEYKHLWEVTYWDKKFNNTSKIIQKEVICFKHVSAKKLKELETTKGNIRLLSTGKYTGYTTEDIASDYINDGEVITIPTGGSANIKYCKGNFVDSGNLLGVSQKEDLYNLKYIYYWILNNNELIEDFFRGAGVKHPDMLGILNLRLPIPPIEVQNEIVNILDKFVELEAELEAELETRKIQYEFYREKILLPEIDELTSLGNVCSLITKGTTPKSFQSNGVAFIKTEAFIGTKVDKSKLSYISNEIHETSLKRSILKEKDILFTIAGATIGKLTMVTSDLLPANTNQALAIIRLHDNINVKYVKQILLSNIMKKYIEVNSKGSAQPNLNLKQLNDFEFYIPSLEEQNRIVTVLDKFDKLINDISEGLPAEIKMRKEQYEYYRDKLLSFEEVGV